MSNKNPTIIELLIEKGFDEKELFDAFDIGCEFKEWKKKARQYRENEISNSSNVNRSWEEGNFYGATFPREYYVDDFDSPLESLADTTIDKDILPPPEIIQIIANQFRYYMMKGGEISLEEAFFGSSVGRGSYAYRKHHQNGLYEDFDRYLGSEADDFGPEKDCIDKSKHGPKKVSQEDVLEHLLSTPRYFGDVQTNPFYGLEEGADFNVESFLRGFRRWKKKVQS